jgi:hypothetical protein
VIRPGAAIRIVDPPSISSGNFARISLAIGGRDSATI